MNEFISCGVFHRVIYTTSPHQADEEVFNENIDFSLFHFLSKNASHHVKLFNFFFLSFSFQSKNSFFR